MISLARLVPARAGPGHLERSNSHPKDPDISPGFVARPENIPRPTPDVLLGKLRPIAVIVKKICIVSTALVWYRHWRVEERFPSTDHDTLLSLLVHSNYVRAIRTGAILGTGHLPAQAPHFTHVVGLVCLSPSGLEAGLDFRYHPLANLGGFLSHDVDGGRRTQDEMEYGVKPGGLRLRCELQVRNLAAGAADVLRAACCGQPPSLPRVSGGCGRGGWLLLNA